MTKLKTAKKQIIRGVKGAALLLLVLPLTAIAESPAPTLEDLLRRVKGQSFVERLEKFSEQFIGAPFETAPLGEGPSARYDQGPSVRFDAFDCTTLVETVTALALTRDAEEFPQWLRHIRYKDGATSFLSRNHFPCGDWVPNNSKLGLLTDISHTLVDPSVLKVASAVESKKEWVARLPKDTIRVAGLSREAREQRWQELQREASRLPPQSVTLKFIPLDAILTRRPVAEVEKKRREAEEQALVFRLKAKLSEEALHTEVLNLRQRYLIEDVDVSAEFLAAIPSGTLLNIVRPNYTIPGTRLLISHQGLVIRRRDVPYFRHVSFTGGKRVKDVLLGNYLRLCLLLPAIHGIQALRINDLRDRKSLARKNPSPQK